VLLGSSGTDAGLAATAGVVGLAAGVVGLAAGAVGLAAGAVGLAAGAAVGAVLAGVFVGVPGVGTLDAAGTRAARGRARLDARRCSRCRFHRSPTAEPHGHDEDRS